MIYTKRVRLLFFAVHCLSKMSSPEKNEFKSLISSNCLKSLRDGTKLNSFDVNKLLSESEWPTGDHIGNWVKVKPAISVVQGAPVTLGSLRLPPWCP